MIPEIDALFTDCSANRYAVYKYIASCVSHRILKLGWEKQVNYFDSRRLILLAMYLPVHSRYPIVKEAYHKACIEGNQAVIDLIMSNHQPKEAVA